ncbi:MAG: DNA recombination protein RmuC [bacterium]
MTNMILILILALIAFGVILTFVFIKEKKQKSEDDNSPLLMLQEQLSQLTQKVDGLTTHMHEILLDTNKTIGERLDNATNVIGNIHEKLGELGETNKRIEAVGKDISSLQDLLKAPTFRGEIGQFFLENLLSQILPEGHFAMQYGFKSGEIVDAIIKIGDGIVPVDSKFPLENFKKMIEAEPEDAKKLKKEFVKDVKKHIDDISRKYILPAEKTYDFALMYIPAENVYYETIIKDSSFDDDKGLSSYALTKKVIPVSPNSFYAYLQVILLGLNGLRIEKGARQIIANLGALQNDIEKFREDFDILGKHISYTRSKYEDADRKLLRFTDKLDDTSKMKVSQDKIVEGTNKIS